MAHQHIRSNNHENLPVSSQSLAMDFERLLESEDTAKLTLRDTRLDMVETGRASLLYPNSYSPNTPDSASASNPSSRFPMINNFGNNNNNGNSAGANSNMMMGTYGNITNSSSATTANNMNNMNHGDSNLLTPPTTPASKANPAARDALLDDDDCDLLMFESNRRKGSNDTSALAEFLKSTGPEPSLAPAPQKKKKSGNILSKFIKTKKDNKDQQNSSRPLNDWSDNSQTPYHPSPKQQPYLPPSSQKAIEMAAQYNDLSSTLDYNQLPPEKQTSRTHSLGYTKPTSALQLINGNGGNQVNATNNIQQSSQRDNNKQASSSRQDEDDWFDNLSITSDDDMVFQNTEYNSRPPPFDSSMLNPPRKTHNKNVTFNQTVLEIECDYYLSTSPDDDDDNDGFQSPPALQPIYDDHYQNLNTSSGMMGVNGQTSQEFMPLRLPYEDTLGQSFASDFFSSGGDEAVGVNGSKSEDNNYTFQNSGENLLTNSSSSIATTSATIVDQNGMEKNNHNYNSYYKQSPLPAPRNTSASSPPSLDYYMTQEHPSSTSSSPQLKSRVSQSPENVNSNSLAGQYKSHMQQGNGVFSNGMLPSVDQSPLAAFSVVENSVEEGDINGHDYIIDYRQQQQQQNNLVNGNSSSLLYNNGSNSTLSAYGSNEIYISPTGSNGSTIPGSLPLVAPPRNKQKRRVRHVQIQTRILGNDSCNQTSPISPFNVTTADDQVSTEEQERLVSKNEDLQVLVNELQRALDQTRLELNQVQSESKKQQVKFDSLSGQAYKKIKDLLSERYMMEIEMEALRNQNQAFENELQKWIADEQ